MGTKIKEIWKDVVGYEGLYKVSNYGNVLDARNPKEIKTKRLTKNRDGYLIVKLRHNGKWIRYVHRLVAIAFISNPESKPQINHIDGVKTNNATYNLEWCTPSENIKHSYDTGLRVGRKISNDDVFEIKQLHSMYGLKKAVAAKEYNLTKARISQLTTGYIRKKPHKN